MACRAQWSMLAKCGAYAQVLPQVQRLMEFQSQKGLAPTRVWLPLTGQSNRVVIEADFESMAQLEKEFESTLSDATHLRLREAIAAHTIDGSHERAILRSLSAANIGQLLQRK